MHLNKYTRMTEDNKQNEHKEEIKKPQDHSGVMMTGHIKIWDISDYNNINMVSEYITHPDHSVHNIYVRPNTNLVIIYYYVDGTRILDITDPADPIEVGYFDTTDLMGLYDGNWGTYAYLPSGYIISSDRANGLFIFESPLTNPSMQWNECSNVIND